MALQLSTTQLRLVQKIVQETLPDRKVFVFGSRARGDARPNSDLDLLIQGECAMHFDELNAVKTAFEESELPFRVDIVDAQKASRTFLESIRHEVQALV